MCLNPYSSKDLGNNLNLKQVKLWHLSIHKKIRKNSDSMMEFF